MTEERQSIKHDIELETHKNQPAPAELIPEKTKGSEEIIYDDEINCSERLTICNRHNIFFTCFIKVFYCSFGLLWSLLLLCCHNNSCDCFVCCELCKKCKKHINEDLVDSLDQTEIFKDSLDLDPRSSFSANRTFYMRYDIARCCFYYVYCFRSCIRIPKFSCCSSKRKAEEYQSKINEALKSNDIQVIEKLKAAKIQEGGFINNSCKDICDYCYRDPRKLKLDSTTTDLSKTNPLYYIKKNINNDLEKIPIAMELVEVKGMGQN